MSWLSNLFGGNQKKDTSYTGPRPLSSLTLNPSGKAYQDEILARLAGRNVGFGQDYASKYSSPIIQNMRGQFEGYQIPELNARLSAEGRSRGSGGFSQIAQAYKEQGLQEGDIFSRLQQRSEDQQRQEISDALARTGQFAKDENAVHDRLVNFEYGANRDQIGDATAQRKEGREAFGGFLQGVGERAAIPLTGGASLVPSITARLAQRSPQLQQRSYYPGVQPLSRTYPNQG